MRKIFPLLISTLVVSLAPLAAQNFSPNYQQSNYAFNQIKWVNDYSEATKQAQTTSKPILILFTGTNWCPACMRLEREVLSRPDFAQAIGDKFIFVKAEFPDFSESGMMKSPYRNLLERYGIDSFPSIVVVNANGQKISTVEYQAGGPSHYIRQLSQIASQAPNQGSGQNYQYYNPR